jgi:hypothetical protein
MALPRRSEAPTNARTPRDFAYWSLAQDELLAHLVTTQAGLSSAEAAQRLERFGPNSLREQHTKLRTNRPH